MIIRLNSSPRTHSPTQRAFTLIELRLNKQGRGEGKMSLAAMVSADSAAQTVALEDYAGAPVLIEKVSRVVSRSGTS